MQTLMEILSPHFLLRDALLESFLVGLFCPLMGVYFVLRRMIFLGVALPQVSAAGIASAFLLSSLATPHVHGTPGERTLAVVGAAVFTGFALGALVLLESRKVLSREAQIGTVYALSSALTVLFLALDPHGEAMMVNLLKGDVLAVTSESLRVTAGVYLILATVLVVFRRRLLLVAYDKELARISGVRCGLLELLFYSTAGVAVSFSVTVAGPLVTFAMLVLPALAARALVRQMGLFAVIACSIGGVCSLAGFYGSYAADVPLGPSVTLAGVVAVLAAEGVKLAKA